MQFPTLNKFSFQIKVCLLTLFITICILSACKKMDSSMPVLHDNNFVEKFFTPKMKVNPVVAGVIAKLKAENDRTGFINQLPANCGLPIWNKLLIKRDANTEPGFSSAMGDSSSDIIIIPLTINNENLSSLLIAKETENGYLISCPTTNEQLYEICHNPNLNKVEAEMLLGLFIYMENKVFAKTKFYFIPLQLFPENKKEPYNSETKSIEIATIPDTSANGSNFMGMSCWYEQGPICTCGPGGCIDWQNGCTDCSVTHCVPVGGGGSSGGSSGGWPYPPLGGTGGNFPGSGSPGSGGGSNPGPGTNPYPGNNPCSGNLLYAWYNFVPLPNPCGAQPTSPPPLPADTTYDPCSSADSLETNSSFKNLFIDLKTKVTQNKEFGDLIKKTGLDSFTLAVPQIEGPENKLGIDNINFPSTIDGMLHSHFNTDTDSTRGLSVFSPDDLWSFAKMYLNNQITNPATFTFGVVTDSGTQYILKIENATKFRAWAEKLTQGSLRMFKWVYGKTLKILPTNSNQLNEKLFLKYIQTMNEGSGLKLFRGNSNFTEWQPIRINTNNSIDIVENASCI